MTERLFTQPNKLKRSVAAGTTVLTFLSAAACGETVYSQGNKRAGINTTERAPSTNNTHTKAEDEARLLRIAIAKHARDQASRDREAARSTLTPPATPSSSPPPTDVPSARALYPPKLVTKPKRVTPPTQKAAEAPARVAAPPPRLSESSSLQEWLLKLRMCESGGNYATNTGNGFYGAYQFLDSTWDSLHTGYARADLAPPAVQDEAIIENTRRSRGGLATQNPGCYQKENLSAFPPAG